MEIIMKMIKQTHIAIFKVMFVTLICLLGMTSKMNVRASEYALHVVDQETGSNYAYEIDEDKKGFAKTEPVIPEMSSLSGISQGGISVQNIIGSDDRQLITGTSEFPYRAMARVIVTHQDGTMTFGSGAMIGPRLLATAGHVLINDNLSYVQSIVLQFGAYGSYSYYTTSNFDSYIYYGDYQGYASDHDYGFIVLSSNVGTEITGHLGVVTDCQQGQSIYVAGYPGGNPYLYQAAGHIVGYTDNLIYTEADFTAGQSGGPIYLVYDGVPYLKGVVSGNYMETNIGRRLDYGLYEWLHNNGYI